MGTRRARTPDRRSEGAFLHRTRLTPEEADTEAVRTAILPAYEEYLRLYLETLSEATPLTDKAELLEVKTAQLEYQQYRAEKDPARGMLTNLFGGEFTERLIHEVLFDLPLSMEEKRGERYCVSGSTSANSGEGAI